MPYQVFVPSCRSAHMNQVRLLSMDFDGTLIRDWAPPPFPAELVHALNRLREHGASIAVNTGRTINLVEQGLKYTGFPIRPNFALTTEREVFRWTDSGWEDFGGWNARCLEDHAILYAKIGRLLLEIEAYVIRETGARVYREEERVSGIVARTNPEMDEIARFIDERRKAFPEFAYQRNSIYLRFCHVAYHKGAALAELQRLIGVSTDETFAAGDNFNDLPMLDGVFARFVACPSNAIEEVKATVRKQGGFVAAQDSGSGIAEALDHFFRHLIRVA
jgi:hydroxymethylpyrimidine pyrophosphatase-like HAD family hydrolase